MVRALGAFKCFILALSLAGCVQTPPVQPGLAFPEQPKGAAAGSLYSLSPIQQRAVEDGVRKVLKDPTSPLFGAMRGVEKNGVVTVCGLVNAKNSFGGYTGDAPYIGVIIGSPDQVRVCGCGTGRSVTR